MSRTVYVNRAWLPEDQARISVFDRGFLFADAVYEVFTAIDGGLVDVPLHLARLRRSMEALAIAPPASDEEIDALLREIIARNALGDGLVYMQVTRGAADRDFLYPEDACPSLVMFTQAKPVPDRFAPERGLRVVTVEDVRWHRCDVKTVALLPASMAREAARAQGADDAWFVRDGRITEGTSNNAYIVRGDGVIVTHHLTPEVLAGVTRQTLMRLAGEEGIRIEARAFTPAEAREAEEAFLTSASAFVRPVIAIDGHRVGNGAPGPVTMRMRAMYIEAAIGDAARWKAGG